MISSFQTFCLLEGDAAFAAALVLEKTGTVPVFDFSQWRLSALSGEEKQLRADWESYLVRAAHAHACFGLVVTTAEEALVGGKYAQFLYIPGEFCRQGDVLAAAASAGATVLLERGAFLSPRDLILAAEKLGEAPTLLVDAGSAFGYSDRVLDPRALWVYSNSGHSFGVNLSDLLKTPGEQYAWHPAWLDDLSFAMPLLQACLTLGSSVIVFRHNASSDSRASLDALIAFINSSTTTSSPVVARGGRSS